MDSAIYGVPAGRIVARQFRIIRRFRRVVALTPVDAVHLGQLDLREDRIFRGLVRRGVVVPLADGRYYLDELRARQFKQRQWLKIGIVIALVALFCLYWSIYVAT